MTEIAPTTAQAHGAEAVGRRQGMFGADGIGDTTGFGGLIADVLFPDPAQRPFGGWFDEAIDILENELLGDADAAIEKVVIDRGEMTVYVARAQLPAVLKILRDHADLRFELSLGVSGVHYPGEEGRELHAVYHLRSLTHGPRTLRVETTAPDADPHIPSTVAIYPAHDWHEREAYDMFGIVFDGHPSLARILMPNDWVGHPQRKEYPLGGVPVQFHAGKVPPRSQRRRYH